MSVIQVSRAGRAQDRGWIAPLNGDGELLHQVVERVWISGYLLHLVAKLTSKDLGLRTQNTTGLSDHWGENMIRGQIDVFGLLPFLCCAATVTASAEAKASYDGANAPGHKASHHEVCSSSTVLLTLYQASSHLNDESLQAQGAKGS